MAGKTLTEKVDDLAKIAATLTERLDTVRKQLEAFVDVNTRLAVIEERLRGFDETSHKRWSLLPPLIGGIVGGILTLLGQIILSQFR